MFGRLRNISLGSYYAQSWVLVHYIMADERRRAAFVRYVQALGRGEEPRPAFAAAFGVGPANSTGRCAITAAGSPSTG